MIWKLLLTAIVITMFAGCAKMYEIQPSIQKLNDETKGRVVVTSYYASRFGRNAFPFCFRNPSKS